MVDSGEEKGAKVVPIKGKRCPICGMASALQYRPFCSERCSDRDLDQWLTGTYRISTDEESEIEDDPDGEQ
jgi:endogenous inhibitor of DNA gyrase (YacG/DUF329 family)